MQRIPEFAVLVRVVESGSFSAAAAQLGVSKAHVSKQLKRLEDQLGVRLLQRTTRKLSLTEAGAVYYARSAHIVAELQEMESAIRDMQELPRGTLSMSLPPFLGERYVAPLVAEFAVQYPELTINLSFTGRLVDLIEEGYDLALRLTAHPADGLVARKLAAADFSICASPQYLRQKGTPRAPHDVERHDCLVYGQHGNNEVRAWTLVHPSTGSKLIVRGRNKWRCDTIEGLMVAARAGLGLVCLPDFFVAEDVQQGRLVRVLDAWTGDETALWVVYPHRRHLSIKIRKFVDFLAERFTPTAPWVGRAAKRPELTPLAP